ESPQARTSSLSRSASRAITPSSSGVGGTPLVYSNVAGLDDEARRSWRSVSHLTENAGAAVGVLGRRDRSTSLERIELPHPFCDRSGSRGLRRESRRTS